jgi:putative N6-adenine-specific DNA methylase
MRPQTYDCYAITPPGEESITARELLALGIDPRASEPGGVSFRTDAGGIGRANVELRTASRVIVRVATCHASAFHELERRGDRLPLRYSCRSEPGSARPLCAVGQVLRRRCSGWRVALLSARDELARQTRLPLAPAFRTSNGGLRVKLLLATIPPAA